MDSILVTVARADLLICRLGPWMCAALMLLMANAVDQIGCRCRDPTQPDCGRKIQKGVRSMWEKFFKAMMLGAGAIAGLFGEWTSMLTILLGLMALDYITGIIQRRRIGMLRCQPVIYTYYIYVNVL